MVGTVQIVESNKKVPSTRKQTNRITEPVRYVRKSNSLIQGIGKPTLLSTKVFLTALLNLEERNGAGPAEAEYYRSLEEVNKADYSTGLVAEFSVADLRRVMGNRSGSFYQAAFEMLNSDDPTNPDSLRNQWVIFVKDHKKGLYGATDLITSSLYDSKNGKMFIKFNNEKQIREVLLDYKNNFTTLNYNLMMKFKSIYSYRLYELMMSRIGYDDSVQKKKKNEYVYRYNFSELKYLLGVLDPYINKEVSAALQSPNPDFEKIETMLSSEHAMLRYNDFQRYTLAKAKKEIDAASESEFYFDYSPVRGGQGGKVVGVDLICTRKKPIQDEKKVTVEQSVSREEVLDEICDIIFTAIGKPLKIKDCRAIAEAADYDIEKIKNAILFMAASGSIIENVTGYIISAVKNGYSAPVEYKPDGALPLERRNPTAYAAS